MADHVVVSELDPAPQAAGGQYGGVPRSQDVGEGVVVMSQDQVWVMQKEQKQTRCLLYVLIVLALVIIFGGSILFGTYIVH